jgi:membrane associated rhomboid family serine protease
MSILDDFKNTFKLSHNGVNRIILVNVVVFVVVNLFDHLMSMANTGILIGPWLMLPGSFSLLMTHLWTPFTYMFFHQELGHIFFNMLWFYSIGNIFSEFLGSKRLVGTYILGGLSGGILFIAVSHFLPGPFSGGYLLGASAGVMAVVVAAAVYSPNLPLNIIFLGPVRLKYIALACFILTSLVDLSSNTGGKISHIGGALFGLLFAVQYRKGNDLTRGITGIFDMFAGLATRKARSNVKVAYKRPIPDDVYNDRKVNDQKKVNEILDKISRSGYESLSKEEKDFLFNASRKM